MDRLIKRFDAVEDGDLMLCPAQGIAWQKDMKVTASYDEAYFEKLRGYEDKPIAEAINRGRIGLVWRYAGDRPVLDIGVGSGEFARKRPATFGYDINPVAVAWLKERGLYRDDFAAFSAFTLWDVIEHVPDPEAYLRNAPVGGFVFVSLPILEDYRRLRESKHYRPGEHLYYFTERGFIDWMALRRFRCLEVSRHEIDAGRDSILAFAFCRDLPGYDETVQQYRAMHSFAYGASARVYLDLVAREVRTLKPQSILDFGCGRSDLVAHFWLDGARRLGRYDPAIPEFKDLPEEEFDLAICVDVMEHVPMEDIDRVFRMIRSKGRKAFFAIFLEPARAKLPDGRNAHVTLLTNSEWTRWIAEVFGHAERIASESDKVLILRTYER